MIDALARLDVGTLALVGDGPLRADLEGFARERGVSTRVRFVGFKDSAHDYVSAADVFCLSSVWEAVSLAAQEAVSLGVPVVATAVGGIGELIEDGRTGLLVPPRNPEALARALRSVLDDPVMAAERAELARKYHEVNFGLDRMLDRLEEIYRELAVA
jgi:glycosyltransferase involved in cell wall biosynthesis